MATPYLIIDGYNLMHAAGFAQQRYAQGDLERCRRRLLMELQERLSTDVQRLATIVFDAFTSFSDAQRRQAFGELTVVYAPKGTDADTAIEEMLFVHSVPKRVVVVSSDHRLQKAALRRKAGCVDSEDFWQSIEQSEALPSAPRRHSPPPSSANLKELEHWLNEFSDAVPDSAASQPDESADQFFGSDYVKSLEDEIQRDELK